MFRFERSFAQTVAWLKHYDGHLIYHSQFRCSEVHFLFDTTDWRMTTKCCVGTFCDILGEVRQKKAFPLLRLEADQIRHTLLLESFDLQRSVTKSRKGSFCCGNEQMLRTRDRVLSRDHITSARLCFGRQTRWCR